MAVAGEAARFVGLCIQTPPQRPLDHEVSIVIAWRGD